MRIILITTLIFIFVNLSVAVKAQQTPCSEKNAKIMILGIYHMDNPGQDKYNLEADDVLKPKRQREIAELLDKIAAYRPTKIAIESAYRSTYWTNRYQQYLKGERQLERNEIEQIGFQLAKRLNHQALYPVDFPMWMNGWMPNEREEPKVKATPTPAPSPTPETKPAPPLPAHLAKLEGLMRTGTVTEIIKYVNSDAYIKPSGNFYMELLLPPDSVYIYDGTDQVTNWYKRNLRIFTNINRITEFPNDRILLIIGAGHLKILNDFAADSPYFCMVKPEDYLK